MAIFRQVHTTFWEDAYIEELEPYGKLMYLYLLTNSKTSVCGVFEMTARKASVDTGIPIDEVKQLINQFQQDGKIMYSVENKEVLVLNWLKYQTYLRSNKSAVAIDRELSEIKTSEFRAKVIMACQGYGYPIQQNITLGGTDVEGYTEGMDRVSIPYPQGIDTVGTPYGYNNNNNKTNNNINNNNNSLYNLDINNIYSERAVAVDEMADIQQVMHFYQTNFGTLSSFKQESLIKWCEDVGAELVLEALKRADKSNKGFAFMEGILRNWASKNIKTLADVEADDVKYQQGVRQRQGKTVPQQQTYAVDSLPDEMTDEIREQHRRFLEEG